MEAFALHMISSHALCGAFAICDRRGWLRRYKVIKKPETVTYWEALPVALFNQVVISLPLFLLIQRWGLWFNGGGGEFTWVHALVHLVGFTLVHDVLFDAAHRWLLHRYAWLGHALHHKTRGASAITTFYMTPADFFLETLLPFVVYGCVFDLPRWFEYSIIVVGGATGIYNHSGYDFFGEWFDSRRHMAHHRWPNTSYGEGAGEPGILDRLLGTRRTIITVTSD